MEQHTKEHCSDSTVQQLVSLCSEVARVHAQIEQLVSHVHGDAAQAARDTSARLENIERGISQLRVQLEERLEAHTTTFDALKGMLEDERRIRSEDHAAARSRRDALWTGLSAVAKGTWNKGGQFIVLAVTLWLLSMMQQCTGTNMSDVFRKMFSGG